MSEPVDAERLTFRPPLEVDIRPAFEVAEAALAPNGAAKRARTVTADKINEMILFFILSYLLSFGDESSAEFFHIPPFCAVLHICIYIITYPGEFGKRQNIGKRADGGQKAASDSFVGRFAIICVGI